LKIKNATKSPKRQITPKLYKIILVESGVSVNWWQLYQFKLPIQKVSGKYFKTKAVE